MAEEKEKDKDLVTVSLKRTMGLGGGHTVKDSRLYGPGKAVKMPRATAEAMGLEYEKAEDSEEGTDYNSMTKDELESLAEQRGLEVEGSGSGGAVLKADLVAALEADDEG